MLLIQKSGTSRRAGRSIAYPDYRLELSKLAFRPYMYPATRARPSEGLQPSSSLTEDQLPGASEPPGQLRPVRTLNNKPCILDPSAAPGRFSYLSWRPFSALSY